jgi:hypothetical protein
MITAPNVLLLPLGSAPTTKYAGKLGDKAELKAPACKVKPLGKILKVQAEG